MSVLLPLNPPPISAVPRLLDFGLDLIPPLGGAQQRASRLGNRHAVDLTYLPILQPWSGAFIGARAKARTLGQTLVVTWPQAAAGAVLGAPLVNGAGQTGSSMASDGWTAPINKLPYSENDPGWVTGGTTPPAVNADTGFQLQRCVKVSFDQTTTPGFAGNHATGTSYGITNTVNYAMSYDVAFSRRLLPGEEIDIYSSGGVDEWHTQYTSANSPGPAWRRDSIVQVATLTTTQSFTCYAPNRVAAPIDVYIARRQFEAAAAPTAYRRTNNGQVCVNAGTYFSVTVSGRIFLYMVTDDAIVNASGQSSLALDGLLMRGSPADNAALNFASPQIEGFLAGNTEEWDRDLITDADTFKFTLQEAA